MRAAIQGMPIIGAHLGEWRGEYVHVDAEGNIVDRHASHLYCRVPEDGSYDILQTNTYTWADGREESFDFGGRLDADGVCHFDTARIRGEMSQVDEQTIVLTWSYKDDPDNYLYELIQLSRDGRHKCRTWHWMDGDRLVKRTIISETKVG
ncbi:hypothetical protein Ssi03_40930 [Sphaerisporangium siamense]|uniref:DUF3598 domain-containing protein n=1 Tax=Sphaerisporangium siamense TaxID=795645 RepID=A0A7W7DCY0_9ACTN|nr:DUF3598 family protein [Sphaerisporangium siamense]MBB4704492.1 hypothetical protein [Sphaerisporangium siamense]GII86103.1 hypothetical protein Ssi03_40930 [Sphaerisporangium siamense]